MAIHTLTSCGLQPDQTIVCRDDQGTIGPAVLPVPSGSFIQIDGGDRLPGDPDLKDVRHAAGATLAEWQRKIPEIGAALAAFRQPTEASEPN